MKYTGVLFSLALVVVLLTGCDQPWDYPYDGSTRPGFGGGADLDSLPLVGTVDVNATILDPSAWSFTTRLFGNSAGVFTPASSVLSARADAATSLASLPSLRRYDDEVLSSPMTSYGFSSFKIVADIWLVPVVGQHATILRWNGDEGDLSNYVDLVTGDFQSTTPALGLERIVYDSVMMQVNAPAQTIVPDFGADAAQFGEMSYSWEDIKPIWSTDSTTEDVIISTFVARPFAKWLGGEFDVSGYATVQEWVPPQPGLEITNLEDWAFYGPMNEEFFQAVEAYNPTTDPYSGEAWLFLPMHQPIDLREMGSVSFSFEFFMNDLLEVYDTSAMTLGNSAFTDADGRVHVLSGGKTYEDQNGDQYFAPLPIRVDYFEDEDGMDL